MIKPEEIIAKFQANKVQRNIIADVVRFIELGVERRFVAAQFGISEDAVDSIYQYQLKHGGTKAGLLAKMQANKKQLIQERNTSICEMYNKGFSGYDIAAKFGISGSAVYKILKDNGIKTGKNWEPNFD